MLSRNKESLGVVFSTSKYALVFHKGANTVVVPPRGMVKGVKRSEIGVLPKGLFFKEI